MQVEKTKLNGLTAPKAHYALNGVYLDTERKMLVASNGQALVAVPCATDDTDVSAILPADIWAEKYGRRENIVVKVNGNATMRSGKTFPLVEGTFPDWKALLPNPILTTKVALNAKRLLALVEAMGHDGDYVCTLAFATLPNGGIDPNAVIEVETDKIYDYADGHKRKAVGVMTPCTLL